MTLYALQGRQLHLRPAARSASPDNPGRPTSGPNARAAVTAIRADTFDGGPPEEMSATTPATPVELGQLPGPAAPHVHRHRRKQARPLRGIDSHGEPAVARSTHPAASITHPEASAFVPAR